MKRILLVEDYAAFREALAMFLNSGPDFDATAHVGSLAEARGVAFTQVDVVIVDIYPTETTSTWSASCEDYERMVQTSETLIEEAMIQFILSRLARAA